MTIEIWLSLGSFVGTAIQTIVSLALFFRGKSSRAKSSANAGWWLPILLVPGLILTATVGVVLLKYRPAPVVIEKPVIVEKAVPCPPAKSGAATTHGTESPAISGSNNGVSYGQPAPKKQ